MKNSPSRSAVAIGIVYYNDLGSKLQIHVICDKEHIWEVSADPSSIVYLGSFLCPFCAGSNVVAEPAIDVLTAREVWDAGQEAGVANTCAWDGWRYAKGFPLKNPHA